ncbi:MAG TPA: hypothetical protein VF434_10505 [Promineifilum sp.]
MTSADRSRRWLLACTAVLLVAVLFRFALLDEVPPGLSQDEVLDADIALFIRGGEHALFFRHGFGHEPLYHYWAVPFQVLLGDNLMSIKLPAGFLGLFLIALTLRWARRDYGWIAALIAGAGLAAGWWPIIFSRIGIRPILEPVLLVLAVLFWPLRSRVTSRRGVSRAMLAGFILGLSIYSYTAARIILLIPLGLLLVFLVSAVLTRRRSGATAGERDADRAQLTYALIVLLVGLLVYAPLAVTLRQNPELQQRLQQLEAPLEALRNGDVGPVMQATVATLGSFGLTGDPRWTYGPPNRPILDPLTAILFAAGLGIALWRWQKPVYALLPVWLFVSILPSAVSPDAPSTVRMIGALPVFYLLPGLAISATLDRLRFGESDLRWLPGIVAMSIIVLLGWNSYRSYRDGFVRWPSYIETQLRYQTVLRDIGRYRDSDPAQSPMVVVDGYFEPIDRDSLRRNIGKDPEARWLQSGGGTAGALVWPANENSAVAKMFIPEFAPLDPALVTAGGIADEPDFRSDGVVAFAVYSLPERPVIPLIASGYEFLDPVRETASVRLNGTSQPIVNEGAMQFFTWWQVESFLPDDLAIFVHLVDESGEVVAQFDGLDAAATTLAPGDKVLQRHVIRIPDSLDPRSSIDVRLGLYRRDAGTRLLMENGADFYTIFRCGRQAQRSSILECRLTERDIGSMMPRLNADARMEQ